MKLVCFTLVGLFCMSCAGEEVVKETSRQEMHGEGNPLEAIREAFEGIGCGSDAGTSFDSAKTTSVGLLADAPKPSFSFSVSTFNEWLIVKVIGTGEACYSFERRHRFSDSQEFGEFSSSAAFAELYGFPQCNGQSSHRLG